MMLLNSELFTKRVQNPFIKAIGRRGKWKYLWSNQAQVSDAETARLKDGDFL